MPSSPDVPLDELYGEMIIDHYRNPRHSDPVPVADLEAEEDNPFCGDRVTLRLKLDEDGRIAEVGIQTDGCSIIKATASMMGEALRWKSLEQVDRLAQRFRDMMQGKLTAEGEEESLGDLKALQAVMQFPVRIKCTLLAWTALEKGMKRYRSSQARDQ
ncbi:MAG: SUF system NifU family Fe-S cluster assembly protein [Dehalococcoidia bacterium]|nr:SUF system NifU family Fe-S cluster assembly protein [Dehalococcoidia bacterium]